MEQKRFIREVWAKSYPKRRSEYYGFTQYDKKLCHYICENVKKGSRLMEVAIGTGYPLADFLEKAGYEIHGIDISPYLIDECRKLNPNIICKVGDAENLEYEDNYFDTTYCLHSTWYLPNIDKAIGEMIRVTRPGGMVFFDIINRNNALANRNYEMNILRGKGFRRIITFAKDIGNIILRRKAFSWHFLFHYVVAEVPTYPEHIYQYLNEAGITDYRVLITEKDYSMHFADEPGSFNDYQSIIFVIRK